MPLKHIKKNNGCDKVFTASKKYIRLCLMSIAEQVLFKLPLYFLASVDFKTVGSCSHTSLGQPKREKPI